MTYHFPLDIEHDEKFSYLVHRPTGRRWMIRGFSDTYVPPLYGNQYIVPEPTWEFRITAVEEVRSPAPPKRSWARDMGLRKPKG